MHIVQRKPDLGYFDNWLWLPKSKISATQLQSSLSYDNARKNEVLHAWVETPHHYKVPRNYYGLDTLAKLPYPVIDSRFTAFPRVNLQSRVVLDSLEEGQTYQQDGSNALLSTYDGILCLRCGAGKTVVALHTAAQHQVPILVVVTDKGLAAQWVKEIKWILGLEDEDIGRVGGDKGQFNWQKPVTVAIVNTLAKRAWDNSLPPEMLRHFGIILIDETHVMGAPWFNAAIPPFHGRRWGLSATPTREDDFNSLLTHTVGNVVYSYLMPDLRPEVFFRQLPTKLLVHKQEIFQLTHDVSGQFHFGKTYGYFANHDQARTETIVADIKNALSVGREVLVLTHSRDMCDVLGKYFDNAGVCHGGVSEVERARRVDECNPVICIMQLGKQALDKPKLDTLFVVEPFRKEGMLQQTMGRILRNEANKQQPVVFFYEDSGIKPLRLLCNKIRKAFARWPDIKGGRIPYKVITK